MTYSQSDIYMGISGDLSVTDNGDIRVANSFESVKQSVNFIMRTDKGDYAPDPRIGGDLGQSIGQNMSDELLISMEKKLITNLSRFVINRSDFQAHCIPISMEEVGVFVVVGGQYLDADGNILDVAPEVVSFTFPYFDGSPSIN